MRDRSVVGSLQLSGMLSADRLGKPAEDVDLGGLFPSCHCIENTPHFSLSASQLKLCCY